MHLWRSLLQSSKDIRLLWASVFLRMASFGLTNQVLTLYLKELGISGDRIGIFMTLTLVGDAAISYLLTWYADRIGRRRVMIIGTIMMLLAGWVFAKYLSFYVLLAAAVFGVISPLGDETGPFKSTEEACIAHLTPHNHRPEVYAFHGLFATAGAALGSMASGYLVDYLHLDLGHSLDYAYRAVFLLYMVFGVAKLVTMLMLTNKCEINFQDTNEREPLLQSEGREQEERPAGTPEASTPTFSATTKHYLPRLLVIFMLDSFGYGFMPQAWVVYYLKVTFEVLARALGTLFFVTNAVDLVSSLPSAFLAKAIGPAKAILSTQAPAAILYIGTSFTKEFDWACVVLVAHYTLATMDVVPRQVLLTLLMPLNELTRVMGIVNIGKTFARCIGPVFTGRLADSGHLRWGFVINGLCILMADLILGLCFGGIDQEILQKQLRDVDIE